MTAYDADQAGEFHFMVMEYVDGVDLARTIKDRGALPVAEACDYIRQAAIGLQHAHARGMVHRDIKPHNLMVTTDGTVKILDFGLASLAPEANPASDAVSERSDLTAVGTIMGTPDFISPEQAQDARQVDIRSDIYSLGATLYYLLSGQVPFDDGSVMHKLKSHAQVEPAPLNSVRDDVPEELVVIASRMMAKNPDERYLTPKEVADALEAFLRTWQPDEAKSAGQVPSSDGNMSGSNGTPSTVGEAGWDWPLAIARILFATACIPVALLCYEAWSFDALFSDLESIGYRVQAYLLAALLLSTIAGIAFTLHRSNSALRLSNRRVRRILGMKVSEAVAIAAVLVVGIVGAVLLNAQVNSGTYVRAQGKVVTFASQEDNALSTIEPDAAVTIETGSSLSGFGVELRVQSNDATLVQQGARVKLAFEGWPVVDSAGLFEGKVLSIAPLADDAGMFRVLIREIAATPWPEKRYLRPGVRVNGWISAASQSSGETLQFEDGAGGVQRATTSTPPNKPELKITGKTVNKGTSGFPSVYDWKFKAYDVGELTVRLLLAENGKTEVVQEFDFEELPAEFANKIRLEVKDTARSPKGRRVNATLFVESPVPSRSSSLNEDKVFSIDVEEAFLDRIEQEDLTTIASGQTKLLLALAYWEGEMSHDRSLESMTAATTDGNATFLFVTLDWSPASPDLARLQGDWKTVSLTESGKKLATDVGVGGLLLQIKGDTFVFAKGKPNGEKSEVDAGRIEIDSTTTPRKINFFGRVQSSFGIYEFKDRGLRVCMVEQGGPDGPLDEGVSKTKSLQRPTTFESPAGSNIILMQFAADQPVPQKDLWAIQGTWQVTDSEDGGMIGPQEMQKDIRFVIDERNLITEIGGRKSASTYTLDPSTNPKSIELTEN